MRDGQMGPGNQTRSSRFDPRPEKWDLDPQNGVPLHFRVRNKTNTLARSSRFERLE